MKKLVILVPWIIYFVWIHFAKIEGATIWVGFAFFLVLTLLLVNVLGLVQGTTPLFQDRSMRKKQIRQIRN